MSCRVTRAGIGGSSIAQAAGEQRSSRAKRGARPAL
jgi:hypothetical protein